jgi:hypothetical protein
MHGWVDACMCACGMWHVGLHVCGACTCACGPCMWRGVDVCGACACGSMCRWM